MKREQLKAELSEMISQVTENAGFNGAFLNTDEINEEYILSDDIGLDSLDAVELIMNIEKKFNIVLLDDGMENVKSMSVGELINYMFPKVQGR